MFTERMKLTCDTYEHFQEHDEDYVITTLLKELHLQRLLKPNILRNKFYNIFKKKLHFTKIEYIYYV